MKKRLFFVLLWLFALLLVSCQFGGPSPHDPHEKTDLISSGDASSSLTLENDPCIITYAFSSIDDFRLYCSSGSTAVSDYREPPEDGAFPLYRMKEGCFVELSDLFPALDLEKITVNHIETYSSCQYSYGGFTKEGKTRFRIDVLYERDLTPFEEAVCKEDDSGYDRIIREDYSYRDGASRDQKGSVLYVFETGGCTLRYRTYNGKTEGMSIRCGDYVIGISPSFTGNTAFFSDDALRPLSCFFRSDPERAQGLDAIARSLNSSGESAG